MTVNGTQYGETREYGNFSFTRVYEAGHEVSLIRIYNFHLRKQSD